MKNDDGMYIVSLYVWEILRFEVTATVLLAAYLTRLNMHIRVFFHLNSPTGWCMMHQSIEIKQWMIRQCLVTFL